MMKKLIHLIFKKKNEKFVLIILPLLSIVIAACVLIPQIITISIYIRNTDSASSLILHTPTIDTSTSSIDKSDIGLKSESSSESTVDNDILHDKSILVHLTAQSVDKDLFIFVRDEKNSPVCGVQFQIAITYPDGRSGVFSTDNFGLCYIVNLPAGLYKISLNQLDSYSSADTIECTVFDTISYKPIENIEEIVEIREINQGLSEIKSNQDKESVQETVIDYLESPTDTDTSDCLFSPVYDSNGQQLYTYTYSADENGYLLYRDGSVSDVIPNEENGILVCGLKYDAEIGGYEPVELFNTNNLPIDLYMIEATPVLLNNSTINGWQNEDSHIVYYKNGSKLNGLKNIDGKLYFFDNNGYQAKSVGIDVSFYNGNINWSAVKNAGIDYAIIRIGFRGWGTAAIYQDSCFEQNLRNANAAGIKVGVYFYSTAVNKVEAIEEASICLDWMKNRHLDFPIYIDLELSGDYPNGRQDTLSPAVRTEIALAFCETIKNGGYIPGVYTTQSFLSREINYNSISQYSIWMASFTDNYELPNFNNRFDIWQFTDFGKVAGINGATDFNVILH